MFTRKDYIQDKCSHREYYQQIVERSNAKYLVKNRFDLGVLKKKYAEDKYLNNIPLRDWDLLGLSIRMNDAHVWTDLGDYPTKAGHVCILKTAAVMLIEEDSSSEK